MTLAYAYDGGAMTHDVEPSGINIPQRADVGEISMGGIPLEDPAASLTMVGHRPFLVTDSACTTQPRLFTGYVAERGIGRSLDRGMFVGADPRLHDLTIVDLNAIFGFRLISGVDGNRGVETWIVRLRWLLGSDYLTGLISTNETWIIQSALPMEPADYRQGFPSAVLADLSDRITKPTNYFAFWDPAPASEVRLFFDYATETIGNCTKRISNVVGNIDSSTTFAPDLVASLAREPDQTYSEVIVNYANGSVFRQRPSTAATYIRRGTTISRPYTGSAATAQLQAELFLDAHAVEVDRITCSIQVPAVSVGLIRAGQAIEVKFSHMPGYESFTWMRIVACSPKPTNDVADFYDVALELVSIPGEECECLPGDDGTLGTGVVDCNAWRELTLGPIHVPAHCTMTIVRYDWSEYTNPGRPDLIPPCRIAANWQDAAGNKLSWTLYETFGGNEYNVKVTLGADLGWMPDEHRGGNGFHLANMSGPDVGWALSGETIENASDDPFEIYLLCSNNPYFESVGTFEITATYICGDDPVDTPIDLGPIPVTTTTHTTDPTVDDDSDAGYAVGHVWINTATGEAFVSVDSTNGAAVWVSTTSGVTDHGTLTGLADDDHTQYVLKRYGGKEVISTVAATGATETIDLANGNVFDETLTADCTFTFAGATNGVACSFTLLLRQDGTGGWTTTWPGSVVWAGGSAPTLDETASTVAVLTFFTLDGGTTWYGFPTGGGTTGGVPALTFGTTNVEGAAATGILTDATLAIFDTTVPVTQALNDAAATGVAAFAARRDHRHGMPAASGATGDQHLHVTDEQFNGDASTVDFPLANEAAPDSVMAWVAGARTPVTLGGTLNDVITFGSAPGAGTNNISVDYAAVAS